MEFIDLLINEKRSKYQAVPDAYQALKTEEIFRKNKGESERFFGLQIGAKRIFRRGVKTTREKRASLSCSNLNYYYL